MNNSKIFPWSRFLVFILGICLIWPTTVFAATIRVPYDYPTLQEGIDAASAGDTVLVTIDFTTFPDGTPIIGDINHATHIFDQFEPFGVIFPNLYPGWFYPAPVALYNPESDNIDKFGILVSGGPTGFFGDTEMDFVGSSLPTFVTVEIIGSGLNIGASLTAFNSDGVLLDTATHFYYGNTGQHSAFTLTAPDGKTIASAVYNGGLNPAAAASIDNLILGFVLPPLEVSIDIKPGGGPNSINPKSNGKIPVAILSTKEFNAPSQIDPNSLTFGHTGDEQSLAFCHGSEDVNRDGVQDLVCHFYTQDTGFKCGDTEGILKGKTTDGKPIEGSDSVKIVPCK